MQMQSSSLASTGLTLLSLLTDLLVVGTLLFWTVIVWRAMRAHERIADSLQAPERKS